MDASAISKHAVDMLELIEQLLKRSQLPDEDRAAADEKIGAKQLAIDAEVEALVERGLELPDLALRRRYSLHPVEIMAIWLSAAPHLDPALRDDIARHNDNVLYNFVDGALCACILGLDRLAGFQLRGSLMPGGALRESGLLEFRAPRGQSVTNELLYELVPASDVVSYLHGLRALSHELSDVATLLEPSLGLGELHGVSEGIRRVESLLRGFYSGVLGHNQKHGLGGLSVPNGVAALLFGGEGSGRSVAVRAVAGTLGRRVIEVDASLLLQMSFERARQVIERLGREAELHGELLVFRRAQRVVVAECPLATLLGRVLQRRVFAALFLMDEVLPCAPALDTAIVLRQSFIAVTTPEFISQVWADSVTSPRLAAQMETLEQLSKRWTLTPLQAAKAARLCLVSRADGAVDERTMEFAAQNQVPFEAGSFAVLTHPNVSFADLVLEHDTEEQVRAIKQAVLNRAKVLRTWKLAQRIRRGLGITCLFDGDPGTGKTLAAEVIASELGFGLVRINIATIVDKYIGETEKNLTRIFETARPDSSILLFDEADSIFAKRTEVKQSNDRYSNMNVNVLLQLIEAYEGVAILTTNLEKNMDPAFERRIMFKVSFEMPGDTQRKAIWQHLLPTWVPTAATIDYDYLAEVELSGGSIKNAIVKAAYEAARQDRLLDTALLVDAAYIEARASGKLVREYE